MPINRIDAPNSVPLAVGDYQAQNNQLLALGRMGDVIPFSGSTMTEGYVFQVGGTLYQVVGSVSITGTVSPYVQITPSGATASAAFVASLAGVSWNAVYNGYYDVSGNRYLFDEVAAKKAGAIATIRSGWYASNADLATNASDADTLDGQQGSYYQDASNLNAGSISPARMGSAIKYQSFSSNITVSSMAVGEIRFVCRSTITAYTVTLPASGVYYVIGDYTNDAPSVKSGGDSLGGTVNALILRVS